MVQVSVDTSAVDCETLGSLCGKCSYAIACSLAFDKPSSQYLWSNATKDRPNASGLPKALSDTSSTSGVGMGPMVGADPLPQSGPAVADLGATSFINDPLASSFS